ncbi:MAG: 2-oxo acid dehydrogenase subunit E2 [Bacteroidota bacterium]
MKKEIKVPDIAENVESGLIAGVLVSEGDKVKKDQALVEVETDKATTDIPSEYEGVVDEIKVKEGDEVKANQVLMVLEVEDEGEKGDEKEEEKEKKEATEETKKEEKEKEKKEESEQEEEQERDKEEKAEKAKAKKEEKAEEPEKEGKKPADVPASPSVRRLARELEVDITRVAGTGPGNRVTEEDVKKHAEKPAKKEEAPEEPELPDFSQWGSVSRESMSNIRKITADNVQTSWQLIPHVTQFDEADITELEEFRKKHQEKYEKAGGKLTVTALLLKITGFALQKFPRFNASLDNKRKEIIYKHYFNIGVAVDTPRGLLIPVINDVNTKSLKDLSVELTEIAEKARNKKIQIEEMQGGNFTISNLGGIGGTAFTPIIYAPQVAILGVSRASYRQVYKNEEFQKRLIIPLSLSYDHRVIDGADGARFLRWICEVIEDPYALLQ